MADVPPEWHERLAARSSVWARAHPVLLRRLLTVRAVLLWLGAVVLLAVLLRWPGAWPALRAWLLTLAVVAIFFVLVRSRTVGWGLVSATFAFAALWAPVVAAVSLVLTAATSLAVRDDGPTIAVASLVEEAFKLSPLLVLAAVVPGWFRRRSAGDVLVLGYALGAGFHAFESTVRRFSEEVANRSLFGDLLRGLLGVNDTHTLDPLAPNVARDLTGNAGSPGHMVWTALAAGMLALAWTVWRSAGNPEVAWHRPARRIVALALGAVGFSWPVTEHAAFNATVGSGLDWLGAWQVPWPAQLGWIVTGRGLHTGAWLGLVLVAVLLVDAQRRHVAFAGRDDRVVADTRSPRDIAARTERRIADTLAPAVDRSSTAALRIPLRAVGGLAVVAVRAAAQAWHDIAVVLAAHAVAPAEGPGAPGPSVGPGSGLAVRRAALARGRAAVALVRSHRADAMALTTPGAEPRARRRLRVVAASAAAALLVSSLAVGWVGAVAIGPDITAPGPLPGPAWLAGLLDDLDGWWSGLGVGEQLLVGAGIAALVALSGGSFGLALGVSGVATYGLSKAGGLADLTRDPRGATRDYLATATWQDVAVDALEFGLTFAPGNVAGAATGRAVRAGVAEYAADPVAFRARRAARYADETGSVSFSGWGWVSESMSDRARAYQEFVTGRGADEAFAVDGIKFDGVLPDGTLVEAKGPGYAAFLTDQGTWQDFFRGQGALVDQAERQVTAAGGRPVEWHVAEKEAAEAIEELLRGAKVRGVHVKHIPMEVP
ncbi:MAG: Tox-REase-5 domain-containing protein [Kineosporiaceae bacterium]